MLPHRPPRGRLIAKSKLMEIFEKFNRGEWAQLIRASVECDEQAAVSRRRRRRGGIDLEHRATRAFNLIQVGELSSARQASEGAETASGTEETLSKLTDTSKRPDRFRDIIPREVIEHAPTRPFTLEEDVLFKKLRSAKRGTAGGPSGMTVVGGS